MIRVESDEFLDIAIVDDALAVGRDDAIARSEARRVRGEGGVFGVSAEGVLAGQHDAVRRRGDGIADGRDRDEDDQGEDDVRSGTSEGYEDAAPGACAVKTALISGNARGLLLEGFSEFVLALHFAESADREGGEAPFDASAGEAPNPWAPSYRESFYFHP